MLILKILGLLNFSYFATSQNCIINNTTNDKVSVELLYKSTCPGCRDFVAHQVGPTYAALQQYINITMVPFGDTQISNDTMQCQRGTRECKGNIIHACAIHTLRDTPANYVQLIACMEGSDPLAQDTLTPCADTNGLNASKIIECTRELGDKLMLEAAAETAKRNPKYFPYLIMNGKVVGDGITIPKFKHELCKKLTKPLAYCNSFV